MSAPDTIACTLMILGKLLDRTPRWVVAGLGLLVGIWILSFVLRQALTTGEATTIPLFAWAHFAGYLFFILSPVELLYAHMLTESHSVTLLFLVAIFTALLAQTIDYVIGYAFSSRVIDKVLGPRKYERFMRRIDRYGGITIFFFCLFPISSPIVVLVAGIMRYPLRWVWVFSTVGLSLKYGFILMLVTPV